MSLSFRDLLDDPDAFENVQLPLDAAAKHGTLKNGMQYFVRYASKPRGYMAMALSVNVGSLVEEESEQGVAHILEHLAFNATEKYSNHDIVRFLEGIGAEFGACQNARTSFDETVYELLVPSSDISEALSVFAEFATKIRCSAEDLQKERGAVLDEWRGTRSVEGRAAETDWKVICKGCKYANRLPIGLEGIIRNVPASTVKAFYDRWYWPEHMAVIAIGDFEASDRVISEIEKYMEPCQPHSEDPCQRIPRVLLPPHQEPRFHTWVDREQQQASVQIVYQREAQLLQTPADLKRLITEELFMTAFNNRLFRISRQSAPPFYAASMSSGALTRSIHSAGVAASVENGGHERALEALLLELARIRCHGFSEYETSAARAQELAEAESQYLEREQGYSTDFRDEYVRHFLTGELVVGKEKEARLTKTLLPHIKAADLLQIAQQFRSSNNCVIKVASHNKATSPQILKEIVKRVEQQELEGQIAAWEEVASTTSIIPDDKLPEPGQISSRQHFPYVGAHELTLENGMKICFKSTTFLGDQVLVSGAAHGGLSEVTRDEFRTCNLASRLSSEISQFGHPPEVLAEMLMGKRVEVNVSIGAYSRGFSGEQSPVDLEITFQLLYQLFTHEVLPNDGDLATCLKFMRQAIASEVRNPMKVFLDRVRFINHNKNFYYEPTTLEELDKIQPERACSYFNECYQNPAQFVICVTGNIEEASFLRLVKKYLASIPQKELPTVVQPDKITALPQDFPKGVVTEEVRASMIAPQGIALITFPITLPFEGDFVDQGKLFTVMFCCQLLETRLLRLLRFEYGEVYNVMAAVNWRTAPSGTMHYRGELGVTFTCDPSSSPRLVELAISEFERLQQEPCTEEEIKTILNLEAHDWKMQQEENNFWQTTLISAYSSRFYRKTNDVDATVKRRDAAREDLRNCATPKLLLDGYCTFFPCPIRSRYTSITFSPRQPYLLRIAGWLEVNKTSAMIASGTLTALVILGGIYALRWRHRF